MSSQSGAYQDIAFSADQPSSYIVGTESEPDVSRQGFGQQPSANPDMGLRYMVPPSDDVRYVNLCFGSHFSWSGIYTLPQASLNYSSHKTLLALLSRV